MTRLSRGNWLTDWLSFSETFEVKVLTGIKPVTIENQAAYLQGWLKQLRGDKKLVIAAAGAAQKASDWIRGERKPVD